MMMMREEVMETDMEEDNLLITILKKQRALCSLLFYVE
jgi:hypothetical protein